MDLETQHSPEQSSATDSVQAASSEQRVSTPPHVVIIGAGFGGLRAARDLSDAAAHVTVVDRTNHHLFQALLYQVATAGLSPADISAPIRSVLGKQKNTEVLLAEVTGIDTQEQRVQMGQRSLPYDYLVIATGAHQNYFGHPEWEEFAPGLKSLEEATGLRRRILSAFEAAEMESDPEKQQNLLTFVLVGAGPTGVEMAGAIAELARKALARDFRHIDPRSARIILIEAAPRILLSFPEKAAQRAKMALNRLGVEVLAGSPVEAIDADGVVVAGKRLSAKTVIWTAGVLASPAGTWLAATTDRSGRVQVQPDLSVPGHPSVFVIGDTACCMQDGKPLPGIAPVAIEQGRYIASLIKERMAGQETKPFHYRNRTNLATVGRSWGIVDKGKLQLTGGLAWLYWLAIHIVRLIGFRNRSIVLFQWAWAYLTFQRGARLILHESKIHDLMVP
ncbi:MAG TPA: NAD(P)/FAD-dependent oxidoreductase [Ktedonosporobacter sp.]|nr:NAD(P)/FAD-dependent oxidoreductase [Ktedonosporobacter sp.]